MHPNITKNAAESFLANAADGTFLIRRRTNANEYVLSLVYQQTPTHHLIAPDTDGNLTVNKQAFGVKTIHGLVDLLRLPRADWPQPLREYKPHAEATQRDIDAEDTFAAKLVKSLSEESSLHVALKTSSLLGETQKDREEHMKREVILVVHDALNRVY
jgi:hypothetical protein